MRPSRVSATRVAAAKATATRTTPPPKAGQRTLCGSAAQACSQPAHAFEPAVIVLGFATEVFRDLGVRQDQEPLVPDALDHNIGDLLGFEGAGGQEVGAEHPALGGEHVSLHALGAQARHANPSSAGALRQPLEK